MRKQSSSSNNRIRTKPIKLLIAVLCLVGGLIISTPFFYVMWSRTGYHAMDLYDIAMTIGMLIGAPMTMYGIGSILSGTKGRLYIGSQAEQDLARVRHVVETDRMNGR